MSVPELALAFPSLGADGAERLGLITRNADTARAALSLNPVVIPDPITDAADDPVHWWILSDLDDGLRGGPARSDHVMGVGGATRSLIAQASLGLGDGFAECAALDLGTGCGVIAMVLAHRGARRVVATDISERALMFARANARLNEYDDIEFRRGDLFEPVAGECFDLILANPPFVITPRGNGEGARYEYRDGGMTGDELAAKVVREAPIHLAETGRLVCLANWESRPEGDGLSRVRRWIDQAAELCGGDLDAWVIERDRVDPAVYAETWVRDGGARVGDPAFDGLVADWIDDFEERRVSAIGLGSIRIRRNPPGERSVVRAERAMGALAAQRLGTILEENFAAASRAARLDDEEALSTRWIASRRVREEREHIPGIESPQAISLIVDAPIGRRIEVDPLLAAALGASDGELTLGQIAAALAELLDVDEGEAAVALVEGFRELAWLGMVAPEPR